MVRTAIVGGLLALMAVASPASASFERMRGGMARVEKMNAESVMRVSPEDVMAVSKPIEAQMAEEREINAINEAEKERNLRRHAYIQTYGTLPYYQKEPMMSEVAYYPQEIAYASPMQVPVEYVTRSSIVQQPMIHPSVMQQPMMQPIYMQQPMMHSVEIQEDMMMPQEQMAQPEIFGLKALGMMAQDGFQGRRPDVVVVPTQNTTQIVGQKAANLNKLAARPTLISRPTTSDRLKLYQKPRTYVDTYSDAHGGDSEADSYSKVKSRPHAHSGAKSYPHTHQHVKSHPHSHSHLKSRPHAHASQGQGQGQGQGQRQKNKSYNHQHVYPHHHSHSSVEEQIEAEKIGKAMKIKAEEFGIMGMPVEPMYSPSQYYSPYTEQPIY